MTHVRGRTRLLLSSLLASAAFLAAPAAAQTAEPDGEQAAEGAQDEIVVTGSRLRRSEYTSTSPVQVITSEASQDAGLVTAADVLQSSQAALGSGQTGLATSSPASVGGPAVSTVSLRGLGPQRTLVLMNGHRVNPAGARGQVASADLNTIPNSAVQRVEILKDGASSIYGSDAVAGVVNMITRTDLNGVELEGTTNQTFEGGGNINSWSAAFGQAHDHGHFIASFQYTQQDELTAGDRDWAACPVGGFTQGTTDANRQEIFSDTGISNDPPGVCTVAPYGVVTFGGRATGQLVGTDFDGVAIYDPNSLRVRAERGAVLNQVLFGPGADLLGFTPGAPIYPNASPIADFAVVAPAAAGRIARNSSTPFDMPRYRESTLIPQVETSNFFSAGDYQPNNLGGAELFYEAQYSHRESAQFGVGQVTIIGVNNATNPFGRPAQVIYPGFFNADQNVDAYRLLAGARGAFGDNWDWELSGQFGNSDAVYGGDIILADRLTSSISLVQTLDPNLPALTVGGARYTCTANTVQRLGPLCIPLNVFSPDTLLDGTPPPATTEINGVTTLYDPLDYVMAYEQGSTNYQTKTLAGNMVGDLFSLPAGAVQAALGFEWRAESIDDQPGANAQAGNVYQGTQAGRTAGNDTVRELYGEVELPLLRDAPIAEHLDLNLSARWTDYESYGANTTYKGALRWDLTSDLGFRATYGTSYRAPALYEQFLGNQVGSAVIGNQDPCSPGNRASSATRNANCIADGVPNTFSIPLQNYTVITIGNGRDLNPETSTNLTAGFVFSPSTPIGDLAFAVDYTEIAIDDQVATYSPINIANFCYSDPNFRANPDNFCQYVSQRNPTTGALTVQSPFFNLNQERYRGIDANARWSHDVGIGQLTVDANASYTLQHELELFSGITQDKNDTAGEPSFTGQFQARLETGPWTLFWQSQYVGQTEFADEAFFGDTPCQFFTLGVRADGEQINVDPECAHLSTDPIWFHTASVRYEQDTWALRVGVQNLLDEQPPLISASNGIFPRYGNAAYASQYTPAYRGRAGYVTLTARF